MIDWRTDAIAATELAMTELLGVAGEAGSVPYRYATIDTYPEDFDAYLKDKGKLRTPGAWAVFLGIGQGDDNFDDDAGWTGAARFALVVAAQNLRGETATRHGGPDAAAEPGSYRLAIDAIRLLHGADLGFLVGPLQAGAMRPVARSEEIRTQKLSLMAIEFSCLLPVGRLDQARIEAAFERFHADWDVPPHGNVTLGGPEPDAEDLLELPQ